MGQARSLMLFIQGFLDIDDEPVPFFHKLMVDHSNQIGTEKVLVALGVNASELPEPGNSLTHEDVRVLEVKPGRQWKTENREQEYKDLADR